MVKIRDVKKSHKDIENYPIIRDQIVNLSLLVCTFGIFLVPAFVAAHLVKNLDLSNEKTFQDEVYEID